MTTSYIVSAASIRTTPLDFEGNRKTILDVIAAERAAGAALVCFPELCLTGYGCEDAFLFPHILEAAQASLALILPHTTNIAVVVGMPVLYKQKRYNCAAIIHNQKLLALIPKQHLANDGIHYETRWFEPWPAGKKSTLKLFQERVPFGDIVVAIDDQTIGFEICEDAWVDDRPARTFAQRGVTILVNPSASHFALRKYAKRLELVRTGSQFSNALYVYVNHLGNEAGRVIYDGDAVIADRGAIVAATDRFSFQPYSCCRYDYGVSRHKNNHRDLITYNATLNEQYEEFTRAVSLGLLDYLRKSGATSFTLSLSGGADSAAVLLLIRAMVAFGSQELGFPHLKQVFHAPRVTQCLDEPALMQQLVTCLYQGTQQNSKTTEDAARTVSHAVGASFHTITLDDIIAAYEAKITAVTHHPLSWEHDDIARQNIQSRVRSPGMWLLTNISRALLLTTGNRSEAAVGYATMDGDTSGSLAPLAGVSKHFIRRWLSWLETTGMKGFGPFPWLSCITAQAPTAELRPLSEHQTDEADLMPYEVLDSFEQLILRDRKSPTEACALTSTQFVGHYNTEQIATWLQKFLHLWRTSQWKRERLAPSFHLDDFSVDSRTWLRYPILSYKLE